MAIRKDNDPGGIAPTGDEQNRRVEGISNVAKTVNEMQRNIDVDLAKTDEAIKNNKDIQEIQSSMNGVLKKLGDTIGALSSGVKNITTESARATKDAISQYGRAIGEDISFKKQNIVAMALARSTPVFGYFAAKFMETDVFKKAATRMKEQVGRAFSGVANIFRGKKAAKEERIPKMQHGGYVEKGGMAELHPAEVVMPIDEILERIDQSQSAVQQLAIVTRKAQLSSLGNMKTFVTDSQKKQQVGMFKGMLRAYSEVNSQYLEPDSKRQLRALLSIQEALGGQIGTWRQVWQKMLVEHPVFRNMMFFMNTLRKGFMAVPRFVYKVFKARGGYPSHLSRSKNPMVAVAENVGVLYTEGVHRLDFIVLYTKATAEAVRDLSSHITKKKYKAIEGLGSSQWRLAKIALRTLAAPTEWLTKKIFKGKFGKFLTKERRGLWETTKQIFSKRARAMHSLYEGKLKGSEGGPGPSLMGLTNKIIKQIKPYIKDFYKYGVLFFKGKTRRQKKQSKRGQTLVEYAKKSKEAAQKLLKRLKQGRIMQWLLMAGSWIMNSLKSLFSWKAIGVAIAGGFALKLGFNIGKKIDEWFGITKGIQKALDSSANMQRKFADLVTRRASERVETARTAGGMKGFESQRILKLQSKLLGGKFKEAREKDIGLFGRSNIVGVDAGQRMWMDEHSDIYSKYNPKEILLLREKWLAEGGYHAKFALADPVKYGRARENDFMLYLQKYGTVQSPEEIDKALKEYQASVDRSKSISEKAKMGWEDVKSHVMEMSAPVVEKTRMLKTHLDQMVAEKQITAAEASRRLKELNQQMKEGTDKTVGAITAATTNIANTVNNQAANTINHGRRMASKAGDMIEDVVNGRLD